MDPRASSIENVCKSHYLMHVTRKQTLRSLSFSYPKKDWQDGAPPILLLVWHRLQNIIYEGSTYCVIPKKGLAGTRILSVLGRVNRVVYFIGPTGFQNLTSGLLYLDFPWKIFVYTMKNAFSEISKYVYI